MTSIIDATQKQRVSDSGQSKSRYVVEHNHGFAVLPDAQTIIGVNRRNLRYLQAENLLTKKVNLKFANTKNFRITTIAYNTKQHTLLAADANGNIMAFEIDTQNFSTTRSSLKLGPASVLNKHHTEFPEQGVYSCDQLGRLTVLAGKGIIVIDTETNTLVDEKLENTTVPYIMSVRVCIAPGKVTMAVTGHDSDNSNSKTDLIDVTGLVKRYSVNDNMSMLKAMLKLPKPKQNQNLVAQVKHLENTLQNQIEAYAKIIKAKDQVIDDLTKRNEMNESNLSALHQRLIKQNIILGALRRYPVAEEPLAQTENHFYTGITLSEVPAKNLNTQNDICPVNAYFQ